MPLRIVRYNEPVLRRKGEKVTRFDAALARFAAEMIATLNASDSGIGLAAQQVGRAIQLCLIDLRGGKWNFTWNFDGAKPPLDLFMPLVLVNPEVTPAPGTFTIYEEGCLSFPEIRGDIERPDAITVTFQDLKGNRHRLAGDGLLARCIQHEVDHLNGVLFIDHMDKATLAGLAPAIKALKQETRRLLKESPA